MARVQCGNCGASIPLPEDLAATRMRCPYCATEQPVPDLEVRRRALADAKRAESEERRRADEREERDRERRDREADRREHRRGQWSTRLISLFAMLLAPAIISVTVFDLPARLGFGSSGAERIEQMIAQLGRAGCTVMVPQTSVYANGNVSKLITVEQDCVRVLAAGGDGHRSLSLRLFSETGKELAKSSDTTDPQLNYCPRAPGLLRYEIGISPASKGRLTHAVLSCKAN
jgi:hypothetical protein